MHDLFKTIVSAEKANQRSLDTVGRSQYPVLATVTNNADPTQQRRIKVADPAKPALETTWLRRCLPQPHLDPPLPKVGTTVLIWYIDGKETNGWYAVCQNDTNPPKKKDNAQDDYWEDIPGKFTGEVGGDRSTTIQGKDSERVEETQTISVGKQLTLKNDAGASLTLHESGAVVLEDAFGNKLVLGGATGSLGQTTDFFWDTKTGNVRWNLNDNELQIINPGDVKIDGHSVIVVGSTDTDGDTNFERGY
jgi:hypothetical protein